MMACRLKVEAEGCEVLFTDCAYPKTGFQPLPTPAARSHSGLCMTIRTAGKMLPRVDVKRGRQDKYIHSNPGTLAHTAYPSASRDKIMPEVGSCTAYPLHKLNKLGMVEPIRVKEIQLIRVSLSRLSRLKPHGTKNHLTCCFIFHQINCLNYLYAQSLIEMQLVKDLAAINPDSNPLSINPHWNRRQKHGEIHKAQSDKHVLNPRLHNPIIHHPRKNVCNGTLESRNRDHEFR